MGESILYYTGAAFLGGVILNVMPCVMPVLTMKVFHVIEKAKEDPSVNRKHGIAYTLGILAAFWALAVVIIALRAGGDKMGWGMQFQSPVFVAVLTALMVAFGLNALGVFEINVGMSVEAKDGYTGSFVNGIVAAIMSTPCSAPFLGAAASFALGSGASAWQTLLMFTFIGLGLSFPFLVISFVPAIGRALPRPGPWMETFKHLMGFTLFAAAIWLIGTLQAQVTADAVQMFLAFLLVMSLSFWALGRFAGLEHSDRRRRFVQLLSVGVTALAAWQMLDMTPKPRDTVVASASPDVAAGDETPVVIDGKINWAPFSPDVVTAALARNRPVFMDYTAEWCANCKSNEKLFIETETIRGDLTRTKILPMKADFTNEDAEIEKWMEKLGREAIPIYVIYYPDGTWDLLPEQITTEMLSTALERASGKFPPDKFQAPTAHQDGEKHAAADPG
jgi:thiol:disulfide interchange protein DsbD